MRVSLTDFVLMILQGHVEDVRRQVNEAIEARQVSLSVSLLSCFLL